MRRTLLLMFTVWLAVLSASAYSFESGGIYYQITGNTTVEVTFRDADYNSYSGNVVIPPTVSDGSKTYNVTAIGNYAFSWSTELNSVDIPNSVTTIGEYAFYHCHSLASADIPNTVTAIGVHAFHSCESLSSVTIPPLVTDLLSYVFYYCTSLTSVTIPDSVLYIAYSAFAWCTSLESVTMGNSVISINRYAFSNCTSLTSVEIPASVTLIDSFAFRACNALTDIICLGATPATIKSDTFDDSHYSNAVLTVPNGCSSAYRDAEFWQNFTYINERPYDFKVGDIYYRITGDNTVEVCNDGTDRSYVGDIIIPPTVTYEGTRYNVTALGELAFSQNNSLTSLSIPNSVTIIKFGAFTGCGRLTTLFIPASVTTIEMGAFSMCRNLQSITFQGSVASIGSQAFLGCNALTSVTCMAATPPAIQNDTFMSDHYSNVTLTVSYLSLSNYQAADYWRNFTTIKGLTLNDVLNVEGGTINFWTYGNSTAPWTVKVDGERDYAESGKLNSYFYDSILEASVDLDDNYTLTFDYKTMGGRTNVGNYGRCEFYVDDEMKFSSYDNEDEWKSYSIGLSKGTHSLKWQYNRSSSHTYVGDYFAIDNVKLAVTPTWVDYALNPEGGTLHFKNEGDYEWLVVEGGYDNGYCAFSGNAGVANSSSILTTSVDVPKGGTLAFFYYARGEGTSTIYDKCIFEIDGVQQFCYGQRDNWDEYVTELSPGSHTLRWSYIKDGSTNPTGDFFALDYVQIFEHEFEKGDVNCDGGVSIGDVTTLIDLLLAGGTDAANADVNGDGGVSISDVTALIDYLLSGSW